MVVEWWVEVAMFRWRKIRNKTVRHFYTPLDVSKWRSDFCSEELQKDQGRRVHAAYITNSRSFLKLRGNICAHDHFFYET